MESDALHSVRPSCAHGNGHKAATARHPPQEDARPELEEAVRRLLLALGEDPEREGLRDTPARVAKAMLELTQGYHEDPAAILQRTFQEASQGLVVVKGIAFSSLCEHHLLPFRGTATIAYLPGGKLVGLSKLSRLVEAYARRLQVQERMTEQLAQALTDHLDPRGVAVLVEAEHSCMSMRGIRSPATTVTTAFRGALDEPAARQEVLVHARSRGET